MGRPPGYVIYVGETSREEAERVIEKAKEAGVLVRNPRRYVPRDGDLALVMMGGDRVGYVHMYALSRHPFTGSSLK